VRQPADGWLDRAGVSLHYLDWRPEGREEVAPPILLLHGLSSNARYWDRIARRLENRRVVALDQRAHGLTGRAPHSPRGDRAYSTAELVEDCAFAIESLGLGRPVVCGHSWGATIALELVGTRPELASALVFIDGPVQSAANLFSWDEAQRLMQPPLPRFASFADALAASKHDFAGAWADDLEPFVRARVMEDDFGALVLTLTAPIRLQLLRGLYEAQPDLLWPSVDVPAVALLAKRNLARTSRFKEAGADYLRETAPRVEIRWFDTPHDIPLYLPVEIAAEIERVARLAAVAKEERSETPAG
jgi:pimeloyl-ACP methyl ester carboxylesterase